MGSLEGKVAVVTGAGRGIGRAEAVLLAREGAAVVVNDLGGEWDGTGKDDRPAQQVVDEIIAAGGRASANYEDISSWQGAQTLVDQAVSEFGKLDILVNNAGILRDRMIFNVSEEDWDAVVAVHLRGHAAVSRAACGYWRERSKSGEQVTGRVVNTSSESRLITQTFGEGMMAPPEEEGAFDQFAPENVAPLVAFLASDESAHITGQVFVVVGGMVQLMKPWTAGPSIDKGERWSVDELATEIDKLFTELPSAIE